MTLTPSLHKALLAGVSRAPLGTDSGNPALQELLAKVPEQQRLWHAVAASDLWQRAGLQPATADAQPSAPNAPGCPRAAERVLAQILRGIHADQLDNWLALARQHGRPLPHSALVHLLDLGMTRAELRASIQPLLGERGRWLVAQHPTWSDKYATVDADAPEGDWQLGSLPQRVAALHAMRRADAVAALAALESEWAQEPAENRIALLPCLATGLNLHDEDFLERALDDKRKEVRSTAQQLLAILPGSQLAARCEARLTALFTLERKSGLMARLGSMLGGADLPELVLQLPPACDAPMKRDGIGIDKHHGMGEKAGWLLDMISCVPPLRWSEAWQLTPAQVIRMLNQHEFRIALLRGLAKAAVRSVASVPSAPAIDWFIALIAQGDLADVPLLGLLLPHMNRLPMQEQERIVQNWLAHADTPHTLGYAMDWAERRFHGSGETLSPALSQQLLAHEQKRMRATPQPDYSTRRHFGLLARLLDTSVIASAQAGWPASHWEHWPQWRQLIDDTTDTLQFRHTMQASFLENDA